jgi:hypothetical protein
MECPLEPASDLEVGGGFKMRMPVDLELTSTWGGGGLACFVQLHLQFHWQP